jgi:hypothetical protein
MEKRLLVIQEHDALKAGLHWDVRFEDNGVLKSFVLPKHEFPTGVQKRLMIHVDDHDWDYKDFTGTILNGYGSGEVKTLHSDYVDVSEFTDTKITFEYNTKWYKMYRTKIGWMLQEK